mmetsp:Transcript_74534/g.155382  ORF Transcript_74534/g.155382 Transcript_74534/m.155382 type:complete len:222 (+) Transcript_74534:44-709(+)
MPTAISEARQPHLPPPSMLIMYSAGCLAFSPRQTTSRPLLDWTGSSVVRTQTRTHERSEGHPPLMAAGTRPPPTQSVRAASGDGGPRPNQTCFQLGRIHPKLSVFGGSCPSSPLPSHCLGAECRRRIWIADRVQTPSLPSVYVKGAAKIEALVCSRPRVQFLAEMNVLFLLCDSPTLPSVLIYLARTPTSYWHRPPRPLAGSAWSSLGASLPPRAPGSGND